MIIIAFAILIITLYQKGSQTSEVLQPESHESPSLHDNLVDGWLSQDETWVHPFDLLFTIGLNPTQLLLEKDFHLPDQFSEETIPLLPEEN